MFIKPAIRTVRKSFMAQVRQGKAELRVIGTTGEGFTLAAVTGEKVVPLWKARLPKQAEAVAQGERLFGLKPRKLVIKAA